MIHAGDLRLFFAFWFLSLLILVAIYWFLDIEDEEVYATLAKLKLRIDEFDEGEGDPLFSAPLPIPLDTPVMPPCDIVDSYVILLS